MIILGFDIGGTKCAVVTAEWDGENVTLLKKKKCETDLSVKPEEMISRLIIMPFEIIQIL
jgi:N-acetylglucosamine kinase-like BadF-type ATPase